MQFCLMIFRAYIFSLLSCSLSKYFGDKTKLIHSGDAIVEFLKERENISSKNHKTKLHFYASSDIKSLKNTAKIWLNL